MPENKTCERHGDKLVWEDGGIDKSTIYGRWYCPMCQEVFAQTLDKMDKTDTLGARLDRAVKRLEERRDDPATSWDERLRLGGKIEGVKLAASYLEDDGRIFEREGRASQ